MEVLAPARAALNLFGRRVIEFANPALSYESRATARFPLMELDAVCAILLGYALLVVFGLLKRDCGGGSRGAAASPRGSPRDSPRDGSDGAKLTTNEKFIAEPILYLALPYNWLQVVLCAYMMVAAGAAAWERGFSPLCNAFEVKPQSMALANVLWVFYVSKILDFVDTLVMIARGKWDQFSFLHVYHHFTIFLVYWMVTNAGYDGDVYFTIVANSFIHMVMYSYYGFTTADVKLSWGWLVTKSQLAQFVLMMLQAVVILATPCPYPRTVTVIYFVYILSLFMLFFDFNAKRWGKKAVTAATVTDKERLGKQ